MATTESFGLHKEPKFYPSQILILAKRRAALNPHDYNAVELVSYAYRNLGEVEQARHWLKILSAFEVDDAYFFNSLACLYASRGSADEAQTLLERSLAHLKFPSARHIL
jgi:Flp pilus assembly protein TadD